MRLLFETVGIVVLCALVAYAAADLNRRGIGPRPRDEEEEEKDDE